MRVYQCFLCERPLTVQKERGWRNWVCDDCADAYDLKRPLSEWPDWARKFCARFERRERKQEEIRVEVGIEFLPLDEIDIDGTGADE